MFALGFFADSAPLQRVRAKPSPGGARRSVEKKSREEDQMPRGCRQTVAVLLLTTVAAVAAPAQAADKKTVTITGTDDYSYAFDPGKLRVDKGTKVHWSWDSNAPHNVTFTKLGEASQTASSGSYSLKFKRAGTFKYVCSVHGFKGRVIVG
jgi:plastocyanin